MKMQARTDCIGSVRFNYVLFYKQKALVCMTVMFRKTEGDRNASLFQNPTAK